MHNQHEERIAKSWGYERIYFNGTYCLKKLTIRAAHQTSQHYHKTKDETLLVVNGPVIYRWWSDAGRHDLFLSTGDSVRVKPGILHQFSALQDDVELVEASTHHDDADVVRLDVGGPYDLGIAPPPANS
jgi:quercetin dioxygenase-like cupin family protein